MKYKFTPDNIQTLEPNQIFVFGSNAEGRHGKGAALIAKQRFGAIQFQAEGLQGQSYAIITKKNWRIEKSSTLKEIENGIRKMMEFAKSNNHLEFIVVKLGCSLAGYNEKEIKNIFVNINSECQIGGNIILPTCFDPRTSNSNERND